MDESWVDERGVRRAGRDPRLSFDEHVKQAMSVVSGRLDQDEAEAEKVDEVWAAFDAEAQRLALRLRQVIVAGVVAVILLATGLVLTALSGR